LKELLANGCQLSQEFDKLPWQHMMFFERDEQWRGSREPSVTITRE